MMKKTLILFTLLLMTLAACVSVISAQEEQASDGEILFEYDKNSRTLMVSGSGPIPDFSDEKEQPWHEYDQALSLVIGEGITRIGDYGFATFSDLKQVSIPSTLTEMGKYAFRSCYRIPELKLPEGLVSVGSYAFSSCSALTELRLPSTLTTIGDGAFSGCRGLTSLEIPEGVTMIEYKTFADCNALEKLHLPSTVQKIYSPGVSACPALKDFSIAPENPYFKLVDQVLYNADQTILFFCTLGQEGDLVIPNTVTSFEAYALKLGANITSITVPDRITNFSVSTCTNLQNIYTYDSNPNYTSIDGILFSKDSTELRKFPTARKGSYEIPYGVTTIGDSAFRGADYLESITMPDTVLTLKDCCFADCDALKEVRFSPNLQKLGSMAFANCPVLDGIVLPESVSSVGSSCFSDCIALTKFTMPPMVDSVPAEMFESCYSLREIEFHDNIRSIERDAFGGCRELTEINLPEGLTSIGQYAFDWCTKLQKVHMPSTLEVLDNGAFMYCSALTEVTLPPRLKKISRGVFDMCSSLSQVVLPGNLEIIDGSAFSYTAIEDILIPSTIAEIGSHALYRCKSLRSVHFMGDAPTLVENSFAESNKELTIYCLEGAKGWDTVDTFGIPVETWNCTVESSASCTRAGVEHISCEDCGRMYQWDIPAYGHSYGEWELITGPTEEQDGLWHRRCLVCGELWEGEIPAYAPVEQSPLMTTNHKRHQYSCDFMEMSDTDPPIATFTYRYAGVPITSYLSQHPDGSYSRIEQRRNLVYIENYASDFTYLGTKAIPMELPLWGGLYLGKDYNFLLYGQKNPDEQNDMEVMRIVRYTKDWLRQTHVSIHGANTVVPFMVGSPRMVAYEDMLYLICGHVMYSGHESNMIHSIRISDMTVTDGFTGVPGQNFGGVSHSMNQFILIDGEDVLTLDHGDGYPRAIQISKFESAAGKQFFTKKGTAPVSYNIFLKMIGYAGLNQTGTSVGGFEVSDSAYLCAGNTIPHDGSVTLEAKQYNIFLSVTPKTEDLKNAETRIRWITNYTEGEGIDVATPHLIKIHQNSFALLWTENNRVRYVFLDGEGTPVTEIRSTLFPLSDCKPIVAENSLLWYVTDKSVPTFFSIPLDGNTAPQVLGNKVTVQLSVSYGVIQTDVTRIFGQAYGDLPIPTRDKPAYVFEGWYYDSSYKKAVDPSDPVTRLYDHTLYAKWTMTEHECNYVLVGGTPATCTSGGTNIYECTLCDDSYSKSVSSKPHTWDEGTIISAQGCETKGTILYTCTLCAETKTGDAPALGHDYGKWQRVKESSCTEDGLEIKECSRCDSVVEKVLPAGCGEMDFVTWGPSCTQPGGDIFTCLTCGKVIEIVWGEPLGHNYVTTVVPPTCSMYGYTKIECSRCKDSYSCDFVDVLDHVFVDDVCQCGVEKYGRFPLAGVKIYHTVDLASDISINFIIDKKHVETLHTTLWMEVAIPVYEGNERVYAKNLRIDPVIKGELAYFTVDGLNALQMNDTIEVILHAKCLTRHHFSMVERYSIATYATNQLNKTETAKELKTLCANMLRYGAKAQLWKGYRMDALADSAMTEAHKAYLSDIDAVTFGNTNGVLEDLDHAPIIWAGKALNLESKVALKFVFNPKDYTGDLSQLTLRISYVDAYGNTKTEEVDSAELYNEARGYYAFTVDVLLAAELRSVLSVQIYEGDTPVSCTLQYSPDTYGNGKTGTLLELCKALFAYSDSAKEFLS